jgi:hypothetical protein
VDAAAAMRSPRSRKTASKHGSRADGRPSGHLRTASNVQGEFGAAVDMVMSAIDLDHDKGQGPGGAGA